MKHIRREPIQGGLTTNKGGHCNNQGLEESFSFFFCDDDRRILFLLVIGSIDQDFRGARTGHTTASRGQRDVVQFERPVLVGLHGLSRALGD
jgi:hypothetical protein